VRVLLVVNTSASAVTPRARVLVEKAFSRHHDVVAKQTSRRGHAARLALGAAADGLDAVVVFGGDGTLNEAVNGLAGSSTALGALPGGSTNVLARALGMPPDPLEASEVLLASLSARSFERVGLGQANGRYFLLHAGVGFDAAVVETVERFGGAKRYAGPVAFVAAAAWCWGFGYDRKRPAFSLSAGDWCVPEAYFAICLNVDPYTYLGNKPLSVVPGTNLLGPFGVAVFDKLTLATLLPVLASAISQKQRSRPHFITATGKTALNVDARRPVPYQLDGEYVGKAERIDFTWREGELTLAVPPLAKS
jgi:diacylglycerol kinase family enzyme